LGNSGARPWKIIRIMISCCLECTLYRGGLLKQVKTNLEKYGIDIAAIQEITWM
jgi:hypothetical protein